MAKRNETEWIEMAGFLFRDEEEAKQAKKEQDGIKFVRSRIDMKQPEKVLQTYKKLIEQGYFQTVVGYCYLKELQEYLVTLPSIATEDIPSIPVKSRDVEEMIRKERAKGHEQQKQLETKIKNIKKEQKTRGRDSKMKFSLVFNVILLLCVLGMFLVSMTSEHPTIINYESRILDRYSEWDQELSEREQAVKEKEFELGIYGND